MAVIAATEFRPTDTTVYVEFSPLAAGDALPLSTAAGIRAFYCSVPTKILAVNVITGSATVGGVTFTAAYDTRLPNGTVTPVTVLANTLGLTAVTAVASTTNACPIEASSYDNLPPTIPAGSWVGFNIPSTATNAGSVCGVLITYRTNC